MAKREAYLRFQGMLPQKHPKARTKPRTKLETTSRSWWQRLLAFFMPRPPKTSNPQKAVRSEENTRPEDLKPFLRAAEENLNKIKQMIADWESKQCTINAIELPVFEIESCSNEQLETYVRELEKISKELRLILEEEEKKRQEALLESQNKLQLWQERLEIAQQRNAPPEILHPTEQRVDSYASLQATLETYTAEFASSEAALSKSIEDIETQIRGIKEAMKQRKQETHF